jgi:hypothetical protein
MIHRAGPRRRASSSRQSSGFIGGIWNGKAKNAHVTIDRIRAVMDVFKNEARRHGASASSGKLWHALHEIDEYLTGQSAWLVNYAKRYRAGLKVGTSITEGTANFLVNRRMNKRQ